MVRRDGGALCIHHCPLCRIGTSVFHQYHLPVFLNGGRAGFLYSLSILCKFTCFFAKKHGIWHKFSPQKIFFVKKSEFFIRFFQIWFAKKKGTDFFVSRSLSWVFIPTLAPMLCIYVVPCLWGGALPTWGADASLQGGGEPVCRMYDTCPLDEIQDLKVS